MPDTPATAGGPGPHGFRLKCEWLGGPTGDGLLMLPDGRLQVMGTAPALGGPTGRPCPEELLLSALAGCYAITAAGIAEKRRLPLARLGIEATATITPQDDHSLKLTAARVAATFILNSATEPQVRAARETARQAETYCMIANALRDSVKLTFDAVVVAD